MTEQTAKRTYSRIAAAIAFVWLIGVVLRLAWGVITLWMPDGSLAQANVWLSVLVPLYLMAFPLGMTFVKALPKAPPPKSALVGKSAVIIFCICIALIYAGSILGEGLSLLISAGSATDAVASSAVNNNAAWLKFVTYVIAAPFMEELFFRKILIDRVLCFGKRKAVLFSALTFGLFHMNLYQFFYTAFVGAVLAYLYIRTGRVIIPFIYHALVNLLGVFLPAFFMGSSELATIQAVYYGFMMVMAFAGIIALLLQILSRVKVPGNSLSISKITSFMRPAVWNVGFLVLVSLSVSMSILSFH